MTRLIQALRRNPDAIALAAVCVVLGVGRQAVAARPMSAFSSARLGIHWACVKPATDAFENLRVRLRNMACELPESPHFPDLHQ